MARFVEKLFLGFPCRHISVFVSCKLRPVTVRNQLYNSSVLRLMKTESSDHVVEELDSEIAEDEVSKEEELEQSRNKSRLREPHRNLLNGDVPYTEPQAWFHETVLYKRKMYGRYGQSSGVDPRILWPTKAELEELIEYEKVAHPYTLQEMMTSVTEKRKEEATRVKLREKDIIEKMKKLEGWKKEVIQKKEKKVSELQAAKEKKDRLIEEVRRHFGFQVDMRDDRFKEMLEQKEKEEKKARKAAKKRDKEARMIARLDGGNESSNQQ